MSDRDEDQADVDEQPAPLVAGRIQSSVRDAYNAGGLWAAYERYLDELQQGRERPSV